MWLKMTLQTAAISELHLKWNAWLWTHFLDSPSQTCQCRIGLRNLMGKEDRNAYKSVSLKTSWFCWRSGTIFQHWGHILCKAPFILLTVKRSQCKHLCKIQACSWSKWWSSNWFWWENMEPWLPKKIWQVWECHHSVICFPVLSLCALRYF